MLLICTCGQKLNTPGATPGRVGKCPRCGSLLKMGEPGLKSPGPEARGLTPPARPGSPGPPVQPAGPPPGPAVGSAFRRSSSARRCSAPREVLTDGLVAIPTRPETSFAGSLTYPLRNDSGLGLLTFLPPLLWIGVVPLFGVVPLLVGGSPLGLLALILLGPQMVILFFALGHALLFLGEVVVTSCLGSVRLPRQVGWNPGELARAWALWSWALLVGVVAGGWPALVYWLRCGDVDWLDQVVLIDLIVPGLAYAQMALVLALTDDSPWLAANPVRVVGALGRAGWSFFWPCLVTGGFLALVVTLFKACLEIGNGFVQAVAFWAWWVVGLYLALVALRGLGLFCHRARVVAVGPGRLRRRAG